MDDVAGHGFYYLTYKLIDLLFSFEINFTAEGFICYDLQISVTFASTAHTYGAPYMFSALGPVILSGLLFIFLYAFSKVLLVIERSLRSVNISPPLMV